MTTLNQELFEALVAAGAPDEAAKRAAASVSNWQGAATQTDIAQSAYGAQGSRCRPRQAPLSR
jgi:hypothetical protein